MSDRKPLDVLLDSIEWEQVPEARLFPEVEASDLPYVTHRGFLSIVGDHGIRCYQLSDGRRVLDGNDVREWLGVDLLP